MSAEGPDAGTPGHGGAAVGEGAGAPAGERRETPASEGAGAPAGEHPEAAEFETALEELEEILRTLEGRELRLDEALVLFERGVAHLRTANRFLEEARGSVEELIADASGELCTVQFEPGPAEEGEDAG